jgi:branched-chain amino acid transport system permease protein
MRTDFMGITIAASGAARWRVCDCRSGQPLARWSYKAAINRVRLKRHTPPGLQQACERNRDTTTGDTRVQLLQLLIDGISQGCIYGLIALGFVLIYKATETVSFAQGDLMMVGAFLGLALMTFMGLPYWVSVPATIVGMGLFGGGLERVVIRPILGQPAFSIVMLTIGVGFVLRGVITMIPDVGTDTHVLPVPYAGGVLRLGNLVISAEQAMVIATTAVLCGALYAMFRYSKLGIAMQAASQNQLAAYYMGIPVKRINGLVWGLAAAVAAIAGLLLAPITFVHANMGFIGLKAFPAAVVGGFGSLPGAIVGGLIIGIVESVAGFYLPEGFKDIAPYIVVLLMLVLKPNGLFGEKLRKKV